MSDDPSSPVRRGLLGWLRRDGDSAGAPPQRPALAPDHADWRGGRGPLLAAIGAFLDAHDLPVEPLTLAVAHAYITGSDGMLCRGIEQRLRESGGLDADWLGELAGSSAAEGIERTATRLLARLESSLDAFGETTSTARIATHACTSALAKTVEQLGAPTGDTARLLADITHLAGALYERTRALEKDIARSEVKTRALRHSLDDARRISEQDSLTGLPNRRAFEASYAAACAAARASGTPLCVAICDIDHFKAVNDTHGHDTGDRVLRAVAMGLARIASADCHVARHGGEEFVIILAGHTLAAAVELLDTARTAQAERRLVSKADGRAIGKVTFSAGVANVLAYANPRAALRAADEALYRAKRDGRNRINVAEPAKPAVAA